MGFGGVLALLAIAVLCAVVEQSVSKWSLGGALTTTVFAFIGAVGGTWAAARWRLPQLIPFRVAGESFPLVWALVGAIVLASVVAMLSSEAHRR
jgi:uncharacterized membrane protein YeaQ/YmgE (transglycosylase-associated protein family)